MPDALVTCVCLTTAPSRAAYLTDALRSYRAQTYPRRELLVVNDGAPLRATAPDVRVVNLPPRPSGRWTLGEKRNVGIRFARGAWLATWDDDDVSLPERLAAQLAWAARTDAAYVVADSQWVADARLELLGDCRDWRSGFCAPSALYRRNAAVAAGGYPPADRWEDAALMQAVAWRARGHVAVMPGGWYVRRQHDTPGAENVMRRFGETAAQYAACAARGGPPRADVVRALAALRAGPGARDVVPV